MGCELQLGCDTEFSLQMHSCRPLLEAGTIGVIPVLFSLQPGTLNFPPEEVTMIFPMFEGVMFISAPGTLDKLRTTWTSVGQLGHGRVCAA